MSINLPFKSVHGLGLYLPTDLANKWEREHAKDDKRNVQLNVPMSILRSVFETMAALTTQDMSILLGRWAGMNAQIATGMNQDVTTFVRLLYANGMRARFKPNEEPKGWRLSKEMGWDQVKR